MRAIYPTCSGYATNARDGVRIAFEVYEPEAWTVTIVFLPTWSVVHSRIWKMQIPYFVQHGYRVVVFDGRGNGGSDRPKHGYSTADFTHDTLAVFDELEIEQAVVVALSAGGRWGIQFAVEHAERVSRLALIAPSVRLDGAPGARSSGFHSPLEDADPDNKFNAAYWRQDYPGFLQWFFELVQSEPHSTKQIQDGIAWGHETTAEVLIATVEEGHTSELARLAPAVRCPVLIVHGTEDRIVPLETGMDLHRAMGGSRLALLEGCGHAPNTRDPMRLNRILHDFIHPEPARVRSWRRAIERSRRALFVSSPIGLGHIQRDLAIARELRKLVPGLEIDWLAQHPVTAVLEPNGEQIHPLSRYLALESEHIASEVAGEHTLNAFQAWRNMDEILYNNFAIFLRAAEGGAYDLWIGDEAWELDYYLHENPELKTAPFGWLTDFVGWLPVANDNGREAALTADYNAEMIEHVERFPRVRDVALFIGDEDDIVPDRFGDGLPGIREWTAAHFEFTGYPRYATPVEDTARKQLRERFGFGPDELVVVAAVGGSGVGTGLLRRIIAAYPTLRARMPKLSLVVVGGPRIDPSTLPKLIGVHYLGYVHNLHEMFQAADAALVQGGLTTTMELVAAGRPFLYFPLSTHFEQTRHVPHRLERYGVPPTSRLMFDEATPDRIAERLAELMGQQCGYRRDESNGARRAAEHLAALL